MRDFDGITIDDDIDVLREKLSDLVNETFWLLDFSVGDPDVIVCPLSLDPCRQMLTWILEETPLLVARLQGEEPQPPGLCEHILQLCADLRSRHPSTDPMVWSATLSSCHTIGSLIDQMVGQRTAPSAQQTAAKTLEGRPNLESEPTVAGLQNRFTLSGEVFQIRFQGKEISLRNTVGLRCIQELLRKPNEDVFAGELYSAVTGKPVDWSAIRDTLVDKQALQEYRRELEQKQDEVTCLPDDCPKDYRQDLEQEIARIRTEISRITGLGGRLRPANDALEKVRKRVGLAISRDLNRIGRQSPELENRLRGAIRMGTVLRYAPEPEIDWIL